MTASWWFERRGHLLFWTTGLTAWCGAAVSLLESVVIVGAKAAETLWASGFEAGVILTSEEPVCPYERPPLSTGYLRGAQLVDSAAVHSVGFYDEQGIELRTSSAVTTIHADAGQVEVEGGERVGYDRLLLATGATPRCLTVPGAQLDGVNYLRTVADAEQIREAVVSGARGWPPP